MDSSNSINASQNNTILPTPSEEQNSITKKVKAFGRSTVAMAIAKAFCQLGSIIYVVCKYRDSITNSKTLTKLGDDFYDLPTLVQRMITVAYPQLLEHIPVHPIEQISTCFDENLQLETSGNTVDEKVNNAKLIPNENNNIEINSNNFIHALSKLAPNHLEKLLDLINQLISNNSLSVNEIANLFKQKGLGVWSSLIEALMYERLVF